MLSTPARRRAPSFAAARPARPATAHPAPRTALALALLTLGWPLAAQAQSAPSPAAASPLAGSVLITGNPLGATQLVQPAEVLTGEALARRRAATLGDTLSGLPGVAASGFGPQASRPVIRGLDGDRIRLLDNGGASADASNLSFDHAVAVDPLVVERIEVLRGPAALLYGGNATGGVVNTLDNRIPRAALGAPGGRAEWRLGGAAREQAGAAVLEGGASGLNWHVDAASRQSQDLRTPRFTPPAEAEEEATATRRVANSAGRSHAGALGASWADAQGFVGLAVDGLRQRYGVVVEPDVSIRLQRERLALAAERRGLAGPFSAVEAQASRTRYQHQELEGSGEVGTTFRSLGQEARLQARQAPLALAGGQLHGTLGLQIERLDFSALGEEAFVPGTHTASEALFLLQEWRGPAFTLSAGVRRERARVRSDGDAATAGGETEAEPRFGAATERRFQPGSWSLGAQWPLAASLPGWSLRGGYGHTERAPAYYELYANGVHVATGTFERGDASLGVERSRHAELGLQWQQGAHQVQLQLFRTRFANYLALDARGNEVGVDGGGSVPEYLFRGVPATLHGLEIEARSRLQLAGWALDGQAALDLVRGRNQATGEALPRLPPLRLHLGLEATQGALSLGLALQHQAAQRRVPATDSATPAATRVDLSLGWRQRWAQADALWTLKLANLGDALAWSASSVRPARERSPAGARALTAALRVGF
ncbi:TonB-dependent receptor [Aquabacterium sp. OR-4]|uniref:TonB-dependent receptor n=1 Tax=Aquabacterium sp. OR-4 TaxID=2978127 RepID=UPI0028C837BE|nr:TonB-dependent receptor [Aquabacterium sp. OR-4]MDT7833899.1 TonB-dependent receptor [Aquabacterium sp. OR-4]